jgi:hypothetical protein
MVKPAKPRPKKPYSPPKVTVYGTVRELTLKRGRKGSLDAHPTSPTKNRTDV